MNSIFLEFPTFFFCEYKDGFFYKTISLLIWLGWKKEVHDDLAGNERRLSPLSSCERGLRRYLGGSSFFWTNILLRYWSLRKPASFVNKRKLLRHYFSILLIIKYLILLKHLRRNCLVLNAGWKCRKAVGRWSVKENSSKAPIQTNIEDWILGLI